MAKYLYRLDVRYQLSILDGLQNTFWVSVSEAITLYHYLLPKFHVRTDGVAKLILSNTPGDEKTECLIDVLIYAHKLRYLNDSDFGGAEELKRLVVCEISEAIVKLGQEFDWDTSQIPALQEEIRKRDYRFFGEKYKLKLNKSRIASVGVQWRTADGIEVGFTYKEKSEKMIEWITIVRFGFNLGTLDSVLGKFSWVDDRIARLWSKNKRDYWELDTESKKVTFFYGPAEEGNAHGQYQLAKMYIDGSYLVGQDKREGLKWLKKSAAQGFGRAIKLLKAIEDECQP